MCRSFLAIWDLPRRVGPLPRFAYPWSQRLYRNLRIAWYLDRSDPPALSEACKLYLERRVQDQADYFRRNHTGALRRVRVLKAVAQTATVGAILTGMGLGVFLPLDWMVRLSTTSTGTGEPELTSVTRTRTPL